MQLVTILLATRTPIPFASIQDKMPEFYGQSDPEAAKRMFERDKDDLRAMGVPVAIEQIDILMDGDVGYIIHADAYYLPEISFTEEEGAALAILASDPGEDDAVIQGVRKLAYGVEGGPLARSGSVVAPGPDLAGGTLLSIIDGMSRGRALTFTYRNASGEVSARTVDAYGLTSKDAHWYLVGFDRRVAEIRAFRTSRLTSEVSVTDDIASDPPEGFSASQHITGPWHEDLAGSATIAIDPRVAWWAHRSIAGSTVTGSRPDDWVLLGVPVTRDLASTVLRFGSDAEAIAPQVLREEIIDILEGVIARDAG